MFGFITNSIKNKALIVLLLFSLLPLLALSFTYKTITGKVLSQKLDYANSKSVDNLALIVISNLQSMLDMTYYFSKDYILANTLSKEAQSEEERRNAFNKISYEMSQNNAIDRFSYPYNYFILTKGNNMYSNITYYPNGGYEKSSAKITASNWYKYLMSTNADTSLIFQSSNLLNQSGPEQIYTTSNIISDFENLGVLTIGFDKRSVSKLMEYSKPSRRSSIYVISGNLECLVEGEDNYAPYSTLPKSFVKIMTTEGTISSKEQLNGKDQIILSRSLYLKGVQSKLTLVVVIPSDDIYWELDFINYVTVVLIGLCMIAAFLLIMLIRKQIINPILKLNKLMKEVRRGNLDINALQLGEDEIGQLGRGFNEMIGNIKIYIQDIQDKEKSKRELEIKILQSQIKPHFVRNTLNIIRWMAEMKGAEGVSKAILSFNALLEYNFKDANMMATVKEELQYVTEYIFLQKLRYQNKFKSEINVEESIMNYKILKLSLQPIIENSINHGLALKQDGGNLKIRGWREANTLIFIIEDDGLGMEENILQNILIMDSDTGVNESSTGIALANLKQRIKMNFGENYGIHIESKKGQGTIVKMVFPVIDEEGGERLT